MERGGITERWNEKKRENMMELSPITLNLNKLFIVKLVVTYLLPFVHLKDFLFTDKDHINIFKTTGHL